MRGLLLTVMLVLFSTMHAQQVVVKNTIYQLEGEIIIKEGKDVTDALSPDEKKLIFKKRNRQLKAERKAKKTKQKLEKQQKKTEKQLKKQERAQKKLEKAEAHYFEIIKKYDKQKEKLSSEETKEWLSRIEKAKKKYEKAKKK